MNVNTGVQVKIYDEEKCVYEHQTAESKENNLRTLLQNLRDMQSEVNNFLTTLIQRQNASETTERSISSDVESSFDEEEVEEEEEEEKEKTTAVEEKEEEEEARVNPKKCKLSI